MHAPARIVVLASGGGSNLQALIDRFHPLPRPAARVELVIAGRPGIGALERAARAGIPVYVQDPGHDVDTVAEELMAALERHGIDLVVLAGYLRLIPVAVVERFHGRMLNIHPALLPQAGAYAAGRGRYGEHVHAAVLAHGDSVSGATVHVVTDDYDAGPPVLQREVPVQPGDTAETLAARVFAVECELYPEAIRLFAAGRLRVEGNRVRVLPLADGDVMRNA